VLGLAGCGVQLDEEPRPLATDDVPYGLLEPATSTSAPSPSTVGTAPVPPGEQRMSVFLVDNDGFLVEVTRPVSDEPDVARAVTTLLAPVSDAERDAGLATAIAPSTGLRGVIGPEAGLVTIDLTSRIDDGSPDVVRVALAQLVYTVTAVPGVDRVLFQVDGQAREVPTGQGQSTAEPLSRLDYRQLLRPPTSTTVAEGMGAGG
jgi:hypothetical protein